MMCIGTSLMVQWLRIHLAMKGMQIQSLVGELRSHLPQSNEAHTPQLLSARASTKESVQ